MSSIQQILFGGTTNTGFSMTAGTLGSLIGYSSGIIGSVTPPTQQIYGKNIDRFFDNNSANECIFSIISIGVDPGATFVTSVTANGVTKLTATATYTYVSNTAEWKWSAQTFGFVDTVTYPTTYL